MPPQMLTYKNADEGSWRGGQSPGLSLQLKALPSYFVFSAYLQGLKLTPEVRLRQAEFQT